MLDHQSFDRSPSELLWVPKDAKWGSLNGQLLNLSYGYGKDLRRPARDDRRSNGKAACCELPLEQFPTGIMRGRFHPGRRPTLRLRHVRLGGQPKCGRLILPDPGHRKAELHADQDGRFEREIHHHLQ